MQVTAYIASLQVRDVSPETHAVLRRRAAERGKSSQEHLSELLDEMASRPTVDEVLRRAGDRLGCPVLTADARLHRASGLPCDVELLVRDDQAG